MSTRRITIAWAASAVVLMAGAAPAWAQNCWTDVTTHGCANGGWHLLQFRNNCAGEARTMNVCVKWTSGPSAGVINRLASLPIGGGGVAQIQPGMCANGDLAYNWRSSGLVPDCPK